MDSKRNKEEEVLLDCAVGEFKTAKKMVLARAVNNIKKAQSGNEKQYWQDFFYSICGTWINEENYALEIEDYNSKTDRKEIKCYDDTEQIWSAVGMITCELENFKAESKHGAALFNIMITVLKQFAKSHETWCLQE